MKKDLTGKKFGRLTAIKRTDEKDKWGKCYLWECKCDCGNMCYVSTNLLINGYVRSCGCLQKESREVDISGQRFGMLTAIKPTGEIKNHSRVWLWQCDCGNMIEATSKIVKDGKGSCGCKALAAKKKQIKHMQELCKWQDGTSVTEIQSAKIQKNNKR